MRSKRQYKITVDLGTSDNLEAETKSITFRKLMKMISCLVKTCFESNDYINIQIEVTKE